jgi:hypothetical protein
MRSNSRAGSQSGKRPTPAEQAETFKAAQEQMKQDAARRRLEADEAQARKPPKR